LRSRLAIRTSAVWTSDFSSFDFLEIPGRDFIDPHRSEKTGPAGKKIYWIFHAFRA
jgi:hypothetical protein